MTLNSHGITLGSRAGRGEHQRVGERGAKRDHDREDVNGQHKVGESTGDQQG